jgi:two-component system cell cycle sensor histidine kinase/response regulator CckA
MTHHGTLASAREPAPRAGTALVVEDDDAIRRAIRRMLERLGYDVIEGANGEAGLGIAAAHIGQIHVDVTDFMMPKMNGGEFAAKLAASRADARIVFTSGYADDVVLHPGVGSAYVFLQKPFTGEQLANAIATVLDTERPDVIGATPHDSNSDGCAE